jgi:hypothetical protein
MPSPTAAISRRIAWLTETTESTATVSGSVRWATTLSRERDRARNSRDRQNIEAAPQIRATGTARITRTLPKAGAPSTSEPDGDRTAPP